MLKKESLKKYIEELIHEVEKELEESNVTGNVDGYQTPHAFSRKSDTQRRKKIATQLGYSVVDNDVDNITETHLQDREKQLKGLPNGAKVSGGGYGPFIKIGANSFKNNSNGRLYHSAALVSHIGNFKDFKIHESVNEGKIKRGVNRWLELKNDESMHANKKLAVGLKELKYQLAEVEKFFSWYNKIKNINELDSSDYWKRTTGHIYKIKERIINIARTLQEIEK
jgi:hypothetical protein